MLDASSPLTWASRGIEVPLFPRVVNFGLAEFDTLATRIDGLDQSDVEWRKVPLLVSATGYLDFVATLTGADHREIVCHLNDFLDDTEFKGALSPRLRELAELPDAGDLRFHALTLYLAVRAIRPRVVIETGVAHGKSTSFILLGLQHNGRGRLASIDLPADGSLAADGSSTSLAGRHIGWLVPDYLRDRWSLTTGNSLEALPKLGMEAAREGLDLFVHDSLHTHEHTTAELRIVEEVTGAGPAPMVCVDNVDLGSGAAFEEYLERNGLVGVAYRDFAGVGMR